MNLFEVFDEIRIKPDLENVFRDVDVLKVTTSRSSGKTTVHLKSRRLIEHQDLTEMEQVLYGQFFGRVGQTVILSVEYQLSGQYNPESLWEMHKESIIEEIGKESRMASFLLRNAEVSFDMENTPVKMVLGIEDSFVNRTLASELKAFLESMYEKRFAFQVQVVEVYHEPVEKKKKSEQVSLFFVVYPLNC